MASWLGRYIGWCGATVCSSFADVQALLKKAKAMLGEVLSAFEFTDAPALSFSMAHTEVGDLVGKPRSGCKKHGSHVAVVLVPCSKPIRWVMKRRLMC